MSICFVDLSTVAICWKSFGDCKMSGRKPTGAAKASPAANRRNRPSTSGAQRNQPSTSGNQNNRPSTSGNQHNRSSSSGASNNNRSSSTSTGSGTTSTSASDNSSVRIEGPPPILDGTDVISELFDRAASADSPETTVSSQHAPSPSQSPSPPPQQQPVVPAPAARKPKPKSKAKPKKKPLKKGIINEIRRLQQTTDTLIPKLPFQR